MIVVIYHLKQVISTSILLFIIMKTLHIHFMNVTLKFVMNQNKLRKHFNYCYCKSHRHQFSSVQSLSRPTLCDPMNRSMPGLPVYHQLPEFIQTHINRVNDAIQPSHPLLSPSPPAPNPSQDPFQWVNSSHEVAKVPEFQQHHSLQSSPKADLLQNGLVGSLCSLRDSQESSPTQFKSINSLALSLLHSPTLTSIHDYWKNHSLD